MKRKNKLLSLLLSLFLLVFTLVPQSALTVNAETNGEMAVHFWMSGREMLFWYSPEDKICYMTVVIRTMQMRLCPTCSSKMYRRLII